MADPKFTLPDDRKWTFLGMGDRPLAPNEAPTGAHLPMTEVAHILEMASYITTNLTACHAVSKGAPASH